MNKIIYM